VATYNVSFYRERHGQLLDDLSRGSEQARSIAAVIQRVRPDILLLNEIDFAETADSPAERFRRQYLAAPQGNLEPLDYPYCMTAPVNTGVASGLDMDQDRTTDGPGDAYGWGRYPGQYGMAVYSRYPIDRANVRTFQRFLWQDMPGAKLPVDPDTGKSYYSSEVLDVFRLSSKSHWDVPIEISRNGRSHTLHLLCSHPTPPVFDGPEDRNGLRNHDEIRLWADYISPDGSGYMVDDEGKRGGLADGKSFVILGDLNADPVDGDSGGENIRQLLNHARVNSALTPSSEGAVEASERRSDLNATQQGDPKYDTADFSGDGHGNLRADYVLPSRDLEVLGSGVFWPQAGDPGSRAIRATDHRLVWVDVALPAAESHTGDSHGE
jgi:hypothetical protein